jgi:ATP-dependent protease ClpP protease subunit
MGNLEKFMERFSKIYLAETNVPESKLKKILKRDVYMDSRRCLKWGVVDELWE